MNMEEFIDLCILCGCDYTNTIQGMGPKTAYNLMRECGSIEKVLEKIEAANAANEDGNKKKKYNIPTNFLYEQSRKLFQSPDVQSDLDILKKQIVFDKPKEDEMKEWLMGSKGFAETKVVNGLERLNKSQGKKNQMRLDMFFGQSTVLQSSKKVQAPGKNAKSMKAGKKSAPLQSSAKGISQK